MNEKLPLLMNIIIQYRSIIYFFTAFRFFIELHPCIYYDWHLQKLKRIYHWSKRAWKWLTSCHYLLLHNIGYSIRFQETWSTISDFQKYSKQLSDSVVSNWACCNGQYSTMDYSFVFTMDYASAYSNDPLDYNLKVSAQVIMNPIYNEWNLHISWPYE